LAKTLYTFTHRRVPPRSDSLHEPVYFWDTERIRLFYFPQQAERGLRPEEAKNAAIEVIHPEAVSISVGSIKIQVLGERFSALTEKASDYEILKDLVVSTFRILTHTPIHLMGLNLDSHFRMSSEETWHALGDRLAPKDLWLRIFDKPGLRSLTMESIRQDGPKGVIRVKIEPSVKLKPGVFINVNDHYEIENYKPESGCDGMMQILNSTYTMSVERSYNIAASLVKS
jgi:hypothetical protein